ncbi:MAG: ATP-dependent zinc metalloprotease FtsH [Candidatus Neomarinimicrobiota bacterium]
MSKMKKSLNIKKGPPRKKLPGQDQKSKLSGSSSGQDRKGKNEFQWKRAGKTSLVWGFILITAIFLSGLFTGQGQNEIEIQYSEYINFMSRGLIEEAAIIDDIFHGRLSTDQVIILSNGNSRNVNRFYLTLPFVDREVMDNWDKYDIDYTFKEKSIDWTGYFLNILPWLAILGFWIFIMRRMQGGGGGMGNIFNFGKSRAKIWNAEGSKITFKDVAGCVEAKEELMEIVDFLKRPKRYEKLGAKIPKGLLLVGPPGTGKTLLARAVAGQAKVPFFNLSGADFVEMFVGVGASRVRDLFEQGRKNSPCIIFIDELDAVGRHRGAGLGGGHDEREQTLNQLLVEMDGFEASVNVILMAATNRPDVLDPALLRPGRFDRQVVVDIPDVKGRLGILKVHAAKIVMNKKSVDLESLAKGTPGMVGADLENLINEAALLAAKKRKNAVEMEDFEEAKDKVMMGVQRKSVVLSEEERKITAYHEAGHTLVAVNTPNADPIHKVSIIPRGRALGMTMQLPLDEKHGYSRTYINGRLAILMGGRAAEKSVFDELTTGGGSDIEQASNFARKMVCEWGMSEVLGPLTFGKKDQEIFLGREIQSHRDYSEATARMIDEEVVRIVRKAQKSAEKILEDNSEHLHNLAAALLKYETISGAEVIKIIKGKKIDRSNKNNTSRKKPAAQKMRGKVTVKSGKKKARTSE